MSVLESFNVNSADLKDQVCGVKVVPGRTAHIDADFMVYIVGCDTKKEMESGNLRSIADKAKQLPEFAETVMRAAGADKYLLHITGSGSTKGGRYDQAIQKEYQSNRKEREVHPHVHALRKYIEARLPCVASYDQEADDAMAQAQYADPANNIVCSADKDLRMVPGWHLDMGDLTQHWMEPGAFGTLALDESKSAKKVVGFGPAFFFAQCLMGDAADTIQGLPAAPGTVLARISPTAALRKQQDKIAALVSAGKPVPQIEQDRLNAAMGKTKSCGPVLTFDLMNTVSTVKDAFALVKECFTELNRFHEYDFVHWKTGAAVTPTQAMLGDMQCLWMRRNKNPLDVVAWLKENV